MRKLEFEIYECITHSYENVEKYDYCAVYKISDSLYMIDDIHNEYFLIKKEELDINFRLKNIMKVSENSEK